MRSPLSLRLDSFAAAFSDAVLTLGLAIEAYLGDATARPTLTLESSTLDIDGRATVL